MLASSLSLTRAMGSPTQSVVDLTFSSDDDDVETEFEKVLKELVEEQPQEQEIRQKRGVGGSGQDNNEIVDLEENAQSTPERTALRSASHNRPTGSPEPSNSVTGTPKIGRSRQSPCILCKTHTVKSSPRQLSASRLRQSPRISEKEASKPLAVNQSTPPASKRSRVSTTDNEAATELTVKATAPRSAKRTSHGMSNDPKRSRSKSPTRLPQHSSSLHYDSVTEDDFDPLSGEDLVSCCWACTTRMCLPCGEPSLYAPHEHVTLGVLLCSVCAENVESIENSTDVYEKHSCCAGCACSEEDVTTEFYFCDSLGCERVFCRRCVAQAHGGASNGLKATAQISQSDSNWHCPACSPPTELVVLRQDLAHTLMEQLQRESRDETFLLKLFSDAIAEQDRCDSILDPSVRNSKSEDVTALDRIDLELWRLHDLRILDFIGRILEELDLKFSLTPAQCYKHVGQDKSGDLFNAPRPVWLCAADKEVDEHLQKRLKEPVVYTLPFEVYHTEQFDDVEDLGEDDLRKEDVTLSLRTGWAKISSVNATEAEVAAFTADLNLAYENEAVNHQVSIAVFTNDEQDQIDLCEEQRHVVTLAAHRDCEPRATPVESRRPSSGYRDERVNRPFSQRENVLKRDAVRKTYSDTFQDSQHQDLPLVLCGGQCLDQSHHIRTVAVAPGISKILKPHQSEGIKFMWRNCFLDFEENWEGNTDLVGGCVLAHSMGLVRFIREFQVLVSAFHLFINAVLRSQ